MASSHSWSIKIFNPDDNNILLAEKDGFNTREEVATYATNRLKRYRNKGAIYTISASQITSLLTESPKYLFKFIKITKHESKKSEIVKRNHEFKDEKTGKYKVITKYYDITKILIKDITIFNEQEEKDGMYQSYYQSQMLEKSFLYSKGKRNGPSIEYYDVVEKDGEIVGQFLKSYKLYSMGIKIGENKTYFKSGKLMEKRIYEGGVEVRQMAYLETGEEILDFKPSSIRNNVDEATLVELDD